MDCRFPTGAYLAVAYPRKCINREILKTFGLTCFAKTRGFGTEPSKKVKGSNTKAPRENAPVTSEPSKVSSGAQRTRTKNAPEVQGSTDGKSKGPNLDRQFLEKIESVRRSAYEQKKGEEDRNFLPIDYEAPIDSEKSKIGLGSKVGVGIAVVAFGLVFAFGDFLPSGSNVPSADNNVTQKNLSEKEKSILEEAVRHFEETLSKLPKDPAALEGEAVTLVELGEYQRASSLLQKLLKETPENVDAYRLLGEVKYELKDYEGSASAYRSGLSVSKGLTFEGLRGLTNALLAAKKPDEAPRDPNWSVSVEDEILTLRQNRTWEITIIPFEKKAVHVLLSLRENNGLESMDKLNEVDRKIQQIDPIQVDLLLGKAYSDWGHISDAVAVYDQLISKHPDDFRGYLAKAIILKENGKVGDAERMFIQARFFAPEKAKSLVDRYSRR